MPTEFSLSRPSTFPNYVGRVVNVANRTFSLLSYTAYANEDDDDLLRATALNEQYAHLHFAECMCNAVHLPSVDREIGNGNFLPFIVLSRD